MRRDYINGRHDIHELCMLHALTYIGSKRCCCYNCTKINRGGLTIPAQLFAEHRLRDIAHHIMQDRLQSRNVQVGVVPIAIPNSHNMAGNQVRIAPLAERKAELDALKRQERLSNSPGPRRGPQRFEERKDLTAPLFPTSPVSVREYLQLMQTMRVKYVLSREAYLSLLELACAIFPGELETASATVLASYLERAAGLAKHVKVIAWFIRFST
jgi:hypothetical protein